MIYILEELHYSTVIILNENDLKVKHAHLTSKLNTLYSLKRQTTGKYSEVFKVYWL